MSSVSCLSRRISITIGVAVLSSALGYAAPPAEPSSLDLNSVTSLSWSTSAGALAYNLYRGDVSSLSAGSYGNCQDGNVESTATTDAEKPIAGQAYFYVVSAMNEAGESEAGRDSSGVPHPPATRCIVARRLFRLTENGVASDGVSDGSSRRMGTAYATMLRISRDARDLVQITSTTGEVEAESIDLEHAARKPGDMDYFSRTYRSQVAYDGPLGAGWDFSDNPRLVRSGSDLVLIDGSGLRETFKASGAAGYTAPPGLFGKLVSDGSGGYTLRGKGVVKNVGGGMNPTRAAFFDVFADFAPGYVQDDTPQGERSSYVQDNSPNAETVYEYALPPTRIDSTPARLSTNMTIERQRSVTDPGSDPPDIAVPCHRDNMPNCGHRCAVCRGGSWSCEGCGFFDVFLTTGGSSGDNGSAGATSFELFFDRYEDGGRRYITQHNQTDLDFIGSGKSWAPSASDAPREFGSGPASGRRPKSWLVANFRVDRWDDDPYAEDAVRSVELPRLNSSSRVRKDITINLRFDSRGRLTEAQDQSGDTTRYLYDKHGLLRTVVDTLGHARQYDGLGRRVRRETSEPGMAPEVKRYLYAGSTPIEERDGSNLVTRSFSVDNNDLPVVMISGPKRYHLLRDAAGSVVGLYEDGNSAPSERVVYDAHGKPTYQTSDNAIKIDAVGAPIVRKSSCRLQSRLGRDVQLRGQIWRQPALQRRRPVWREPALRYQQDLRPLKIAQRYAGQADGAGMTKSTG